MIFAEYKKRTKNEIEVIILILVLGSIMTSKHILSLVHGILPTENNNNKITEDQPEILSKPSVNLSKQLVE